MDNTSKEKVRKKVSIIDALLLPKYIKISPKDWEKESRKDNLTYEKKLDKEHSKLIKYKNLKKLNR